LKIPPPHLGPTHTPIPQILVFLAKQDKRVVRQKYELQRNLKVQKRAFEAIGVKKIDILASLRNK
jgi:hypothetical protein